MCFSRTGAITMMTGSPRFMTIKLRISSIAKNVIFRFSKFCVFQNFELLQMALDLDAENAEPMKIDEAGNDDESENEEGEDRWIYCNYFLLDLRAVDPEMKSS